MKLTYTILFAIVLSFTAKSQTSTTNKIPLARQYFHENIQESQKKIFSLDGVNDSVFAPTANDQLNHELNNAASKKVNDIQHSIEADTTLNSNNKIKFLRGLNETLVAYINGSRAGSIKYSVLPDLLDAFSACISKEKNNKSIAPEISNFSYDVGNILIHTIAYSDNPGIEDCRNILLLKYCDKYKDKALLILSQHPDLPFTDSLITVIARQDPESLYTYAAATNSLATKIHNNPDSLVQIINMMATSKSGRQYFPFIDNIYRGKLSFDKINAVMDNDVQYYKLLVQTAIDYADRMRLRDTPMGLEGLSSKLEKKAIDPFINTINGLHESSDEVRFRILQPFSPQDLYYMTVVGEEIIYTSSYVKGIYPRIWQRMKNPKGDSLLLSVRFDHFKKWIKMAANYNTLDDFLNRMDDNNAQMLMKAFVNGLDKTQSLEDAVDVANSYGGISNKQVQMLILNQVKVNLQQAQQNNNERATDIYSILNTLFLSMDTSQHINVSDKLGIPPVYYMPNKNLQNDAGKIVVQQFFYGDSDGKTFFNEFLRSFSSASWKINYAAEWVSVSSTKGTPVVVYANKPLDEKQNLDAQAQSDLNDYLAEHDLEPSIVIHRGHSYWLPSTLQQLEPAAKIVLLGSCGAYQNLNKILRICPTAQIVASKQTGAGSVNDPMIFSILEVLRQGKDLNWPQLWNTLSHSISNKELFDDYVPPHKNLGALFLMAYKKMQEKDELANEN